MGGDGSCWTPLLQCYNGPWGEQLSAAFTIGEHLKFEGTLKVTKSNSQSTWYEHLANHPGPSPCTCEV